MAKMVNMTQKMVKFVKNSNTDENCFKKPKNGKNGKKIEENAFGRQRTFY